MRFGTWNVRSMYRPRQLTTVARKVVRYRLDSVGMQVGPWGGEEAEQVRIIVFCEENAMGGACCTYGAGGEFHTWF